MKNVIPEIRTTICDRCGEQSEHERFGLEGKVQFGRLSRNHMYGALNADPTKFIDFCDACTEAFSVWIETPDGIQTLEDQA